MASCISVTFLLVGATATTTIQPVFYWAGGDFMGGAATDLTSLLPSDTFRDEVSVAFTARIDSSSGYNMVSLLSDNFKMDVMHGWSELNWVSAWQAADVRLGISVPSGEKKYLFTVGADQTTRIWVDGSIAATGSTHQYWGNGVSDKSLTGLLVGNNFAGRISGLRIWSQAVTWAEIDWAQIATTSDVPLTTTTDAATTSDLPVTTTTDTTTTIEVPVTTTKDTTTTSDVPLTTTMDAATTSGAPVATTTDDVRVPLATTTTTTTTALGCPVHQFITHDKSCQDCPDSMTPTPDQLGCQDGTDFGLTSGEWDVILGVCGVFATIVTGVTGVSCYCFWDKIKEKCLRTTKTTGPTTTPATGADNPAQGKKEQGPPTGTKASVPPQESDSKV